MGLSGRRAGWGKVPAQVGLAACACTNSRVKVILRVMKVQPDEAEERLPEYEFDYQEAKPNRFALAEQQRVVILEPDVAEYFHNSEAVNRVLRALIEVMPRAA